jgi:AcrR family transcriptional regulator
MAPARRTEEATRALRADLIGTARGIIERDGATGLTMRSLAAEANCAVGLIYKIFADREELVSELLREEFGQLSAALELWVAEAGERTVADNLARYAHLLLDSPAVALSAQVGHDRTLAHALDVEAADTGVVAALESAVVRYLAAEKRIGRIDRAVDDRAFGFLIAGSIHNLLVSGELYPRPSRQRMDDILRAVAERLLSTLAQADYDASKV